jgi:type I restriction enzyme R subunit
MDAIYAAHAWTPVQRKWLERLAKQLVHEVVLDLDTINASFNADGGVKRLDKILNQQLDSVLDEMNAALWPQQSA